MDLVIAAKIAESVAGAIAKGAGALVGAKANVWLKDRAEGQAYERAIAAALDDFGARYPDLAASFFDEHFLRGPVADELALFFLRHRTPDPANVARAYAAQFAGVGTSDVAIAAQYFIRQVEERMKEAAPLQDLINRRQIEQGARILQHLEGRLQGAPDAPDLQVSTRAMRDPAEATRVEGAFDTASEELIAWPQTLQDGRWIPRPELEQLEGSFAEERSLLVLIGPPGSGKSAVMARLAAQARSHGYAVLGIKADQLPEDISSLNDLGRWLDLTLPLSDALALVASQKKTILLIDQLDALSALVDLRTGRLTALLSLIRRASVIPNLHIVCSSRTFERRYDARLSTLEGTEIALPLLPWATVNAILSERKINAEHWPAGFRDLLCYPQHLNLFLRFFSGSSESAIFESYQAMLEHIWRERLFPRGENASAAQLLQQIALYMAEREILHSAGARWEAQRADLDYLVGSGILQYDPTRRQISFTHQTLFDFAHARAFVAQEGSLSGFVLQRQTALYVRPKLWSALVYLRATDDAAYKREFQTIWNEPSLREHLRLLLIDFAGMQEAPRVFEIDAVRGALSNSRLIAKTMNAISGRKAWFDVVKSEVVPAVMGRELAEAWPARGILADALSFDREVVLRLLGRYWLSDQRKRELLLSVLSSADRWDEDMFALAARAIQPGGIPDFTVYGLASTASVTTPEIGVKLAVAQIRPKLEAAAATTPAPRPELESGATEDEKVTALILHEPRKALKSVLDTTSTEWYELAAIVEAAPLTWLDEMWPILRDALKLVADDHPPARCCFREDHYMSTMFEEGGIGHREYPIVDSTLIAVRELAKRDPTRFAAFVRDNETADSMSIQRLLAIGLSDAAASLSAVGLGFLLGDERRLHLQNLHESERETKLLIRSIAPHLSDRDLEALEQYILRATVMGPEGRSEDPKARFKYQKWDRQFRLRLLLQMPEDKLSASTRKLIRTEVESAFPGFKDERHVPQVFRGTSSMSAIQMALASDRALLNYLLEYPDNTEWGDIFERRSGSIEVSRAFAEFAVKAPERALRLCGVLSPETHQRPVGHVLETLSPEALPLQKLLELVEHFDEIGFCSPHFREQAAAAFRKRVISGQGLPDSVIELLERWLLEYEIDPTHPESDEGQIKKEDRAESILWGYGGTMIVPNFSYPILTAILWGLIARHPVPSARLFDILEAHLSRRDVSRVWEMIAFDLSQNAHRCDFQRLEGFVDRFFENYPNLLRTKAGIWLLAHGLRFLSAPTAVRWLDQMRAGEGAGHKQAYGELVMLYAVLAPQEQWVKDRIENVIDPGTDEEGKLQILTGMVYGAANLWGDVDDPTSLARVLATGAQSSDPEVARATLDWFRVVPHTPLTVQTRTVFQALSDGAALGAVTSYTFLLEALLDLVGDAPELAYLIARKIVESAGRNMSNLGSSLAMDAEALINIALTLQRLDEPHRSNGLALFERLLELDAYRAREALMDVDLRPGVAMSSRPRRRRLRGSRKA